MLVLTRKQDEMIQIGADIVIKVISAGKGKVKIGVDAPAEVRVMRAELADEVKAQRLAATPVVPSIAAPSIAKPAVTAAAPLAGRLKLRAAS